MTNARSMLPVPYFAIDSQYRILERSELSSSQFPPTEQFRELVDIGSEEKLERFIRPMQDQRVELNLMYGPRKQPMLFEVHQCWENESIGHLVLIRNQHRLQPLLDSMERMREELTHVTRQASSPLSPSPSPSRHLTSVPRSEGSVQESSKENYYLELHDALVTIDDLLAIVRSTLMESGKDAYTMLLLEQTAHAKELVRKLQQYK
ncbi:hypothetical protein [Paenibacillus sp. YYML68]|uniref:hypothetical protein n=1 Tax=Paenibacillus sp. YYML68 TaxID=2909250 RepID=UPI00248FF99F|nr:hypothetical protein [Paenibacillus sp. YYML68]